MGAMNAYRPNEMANLELGLLSRTVDMFRDTSNSFEPHRPIVISQTYPEGSIDNLSKLDYLDWQSLDKAISGISYPFIIRPPSKETDYVANSKVAIAVTESQTIYEASPGTREFVRASLGEELFEKLSEHDIEFLAAGSSLLDLGPNVDVGGLLKSAKGLQ